MDTRGKPLKGKMFIIHMERRTQRRGKHFDSEYGDYQEEVESDYLSHGDYPDGGVIDGGVVDCNDSDCSIYDTYESAPELKKGFRIPSHSPWISPKVFFVS